MAIFANFAYLNKTITQMIRLNCFIRVDAAKRDALVAAARELVEKSLTDEGCIAYDLFESATRPDVLMICETWRDQAALDAHAASAHFTRLVPLMQSMAELSIEQFDC